MLLLEAGHRTWVRLEPTSSLVGTCVGVAGDEDEDEDDESSTWVLLVVWTQSHSGFGAVSPAHSLRSS